MSLNIFGRQAASRRDANRHCVICEKPFDAPATILSMLLVDLPADFPWTFFDGSSCLVLAGLCGRCRPIIETPQKLKKILLRGTSGDWQIPVISPDFSVRLLDPVHDLSNPAINEMTFFEGRSQPLATHCKNTANLLKYCCDYESRGIRVVGYFYSPEDIATVYHFGLLFAQEGFGEGTPFWCLDPRLLGPYSIAYLLKNEDRTSYVGVVVFDTQEYSTLAWAWLHPSARRKGVLSRIWLDLEHSHLNFKVLAPISTGMRRFLAKHPGHELTEQTGAAK